MILYYFPIAQNQVADKGRWQNTFQDTSWYSKIVICVGYVCVGIFLIFLYWSDTSLNKTPLAQY